MFILILLLSSWSIVYSDPLNILDEFLHFPPPYIQSNDEFAKATRYLQLQLPYANNSESNLELGVIVRIVSELAYAIRPQSPPQRYMPCKILHDYLPYAWKEYKYIVNRTQDLLLYAGHKIEPISSIIDSICRGVNETEVCNQKVADIVKTKDYLQPNANLLLQLGQVSIVFNAFSHTIDALSHDNQQIPFLKHHAEDPHVRHFMKELYKTYSLIQNMK